MPDENKRVVGFDYYRPISRQQAEFHASRARHKLLIGGVGAGKSYPAIHESIFHCMENPGHTFLIARNTRDAQDDNILDDFVHVTEKGGVFKKIQKTAGGDHDITLVNGCKLLFRPLSLGKRVFKGYHLCGFMLDDPDTRTYEDLISFLYSRLRNPPTVKASKFISIITANYEGHDWLWRTFMKDKEPGGDETYAYWICPTQSNPTLPENYIEDQAKVHSQEWMDRYIYCNFNITPIGLIYYMFDPKIHHRDAGDLLEKRGIIKVLSIDVGYVTCVLKMATDGKAIYVYDEEYRKGWSASHLGDYLRRIYSKGHFKKAIIDPASAKREMTSDSSVRAEIRRHYGIYTQPADNSVLNGIRLVKDVFMPSDGNPLLFIDIHRCPNLRNEIGMYRWKEPKNLDMDNADYPEEPVKKNDHACDALRYGVMELKKYLRGFGEIDRREQLMEERRKRWENLRFYKENPERRIFEERGYLRTRKKKGKMVKVVM